MFSICRSVASRCSIRGRLPFDLSLYLVANRSSFQDESLFFKKITESVRGGVTCVQLRDHRSDVGVILKTALGLRKMLQNVPFFINTPEPFELARAVKADGVYLEGQFSYIQARRLLGQKAIIGISVKTMDDVLSIEQRNEIDYLSIKVFPSKQTCPRNDLLWGMEGLRKVRAISSHRIVAIGGLNIDQTESIYRELRFNDGIAMAGGLMGEENPYLTAQKIQDICQKVRGSGS